jgi:tellurite resistance protein
MDAHNIFREIGRMAYAVAKSNGEVKEKEVESIFYFIDEEMEELGNNDVMSVGEEFTKLRRMNVSAKDAFLMFLNFVERNGNSLHNSLKKMCIRLAVKIANADESADETETAMINKLMKKLEMN